jgi:tetratricopeptide (TPR) repeat protein
MHTQAGRLDEAIALCIKARDGYARLLGDDHAATLAAVTALAVLHEKLDRFDEAKALYVQALEGTERTAGAGHVRALHVVCNLAHLHRYDPMRCDATL